MDDDFPRFLICGASSGDDAGLVYRALKQARCVADFTDHYKISCSFDPLRHLGLIILGAMKAHSDNEDVYGHEMSWVRIALKNGKAILGICHGAQLLAHTCGKKLTYGNRKADMGVTRVTLTHHGEKDPVLRHVGPEGEVIQWHSDTFEVPDRAIDLAHSTNMKRPHSDAFCMGRNVYGLQFHPDPTKEMLKDDPEWFAQGAVPEEKTLASVEETSLAVLTAWVTLALGQ